MNGRQELREVATTTINIDSRGASYLRRGGELNDHTD
jgi:hypothetical protein